jgi:hypothetical protein
MCLSALRLSVDGHVQRRTTYGLGTSLTKIHLTLKIPFHLSDAQTVEFFDSSTLPDQLHDHRLGLRKLTESASRRHRRNA